MSHHLSGIPKIGVPMQSLDDSPPVVTRGFFGPHIQDDYEIDHESLMCLQQYFSRGVGKTNYSYETLEKAAKKADVIFKRMGENRTVDENIWSFIFKLVDTYNEPSYDLRIRQVITDSLINSALFTKKLVALTSYILLPSSNSEFDRLCLLLKIGCLYHLVISDSARQIITFIENGLINFKGTEEQLKRIKKIESILSLKRPSREIPIPAAASAAASPVEVRVTESPPADASLSPSQAVRNPAATFKGFFKSFSAPVIPKTPPSPSVFRLKPVQQTAAEPVKIDRPPFVGSPLATPLKRVLEPEDRLADIEADKRQTKELQVAKLQAKLEILWDMFLPEVSKHCQGPYKEEYFVRLKAQLPFVTSFLFINEPRKLIDSEKKLILSGVKATRDFIGDLAQVRAQTKDKNMRHNVLKLLEHREIPEENLNGIIKQEIEKLFSILTNLEGSNFLPIPQASQYFMRDVLSFITAEAIERITSPRTIKFFIHRFFEDTLVLDNLEGPKVGNTAYNLEDRPFTIHVGGCLKNIIDSLLVLSDNSNILTKSALAFALPGEEDLGKEVLDGLNDILQSEVSMRPFLIFFHLLVKEQDGDYEKVLGRNWEEIGDLRIILPQILTRLLAEKSPFIAWLTKNNSLFLSFIDLFIGFIENPVALKVLFYYQLVNLNKQFFNQGDYK